MKPLRPSWLHSLATVAVLVSAQSSLAQGGLAQSSLSPARAEDPPQKTDAAKAKERELLDQSFKSLEEELKYAVQEFATVQSAAAAKGLPRDQWPKNPAVDFYPRFEPLAMAGQPDAQRWCIGVMPSAGFAMDEMISRKDALYKRYVETNVNAAPTSDILQFLEKEPEPGGIGLDRTLPLVEEIVKLSKVPTVRAQAMWVRATLYAGSKRSEHAPLALKYLHEFVDTYPNNKDAAQAKGMLFQREHLAVGMVAPDVVTKDVDGAPFKLSDSRGKVTLILFFAGSRPNSVQVLGQVKTAVDKVKDKPVSVIAVTIDEEKDKADFKKRFANLTPPFKVSWQGSRTGPWILDWGINRVPTLYLIDDLGVIRFVNPDVSKLGASVDALLAEMEARAKPPPK